MFRSHFCFCIFCSLLGLALAILMLFGAPSASVAQEKISFIKDVAPILNDNCMACHDAKKKKGKLDLSTYASLRKGGQQGDPIIPGMHRASMFWLLITETGKARMPPPDSGDALSKKQLDTITAWIDQGAKLDGGIEPTANLRRELRLRWEPPSPPTAYKYPANINAVVFTPDNKHLVAGGYHELTVWDAKEGKLLKRIHTREERIYAMAFLRDGRLVTAGGRPGQEGKVRVYHINAKPAKSADGVGILDGVNDDKVFLKELLDTNDVLLALAVSKDGNQLAAAGCDRLVRIWDIGKGVQKAQLNQEIENHADWVFGLAFSPDGNRLLTSSRDKTAKIWDLKAKESLVTFPSHQETVYDVAISADNKTAFSVGQDTNVRFWRAYEKDKNFGKQIRAVGSHNKVIFKIVRHPDPKKDLVATCSADGTVRLFSTNNGQNVKTFTGHTDWVYALAISPNGQRIASGSWNGEVRIWNIDDGKLVTEFNASPGYSPEKKTAASK